MSAAPHVGTEQCLRAVCLPLEDGSPIDPFSLAGPIGIVIANQELTLVGIGTAVSIPLAGGLEDDQGIVGVQRRLAAIDTDDRVNRPGSVWSRSADFPSTGSRLDRLSYPSSSTGGRPTDRNG